MRLYLEFDKLVRALLDARVKFAVAGGLAVGLHGFLRMTKDIDLLVREGELEKIREILKCAGYRENSQQVNFQNSGLRLCRFWRRLPDMEELLMVDVLVAESAGTSRILRRARPMRYANLKVPVVSRADLIEMKQLRGSKLDEADIEKLAKRRGQKKKTNHSR